MLYLISLNGNRVSGTQFPFKEIEYKIVVSLGFFFYWAATLATVNSNYFPSPGSSKLDPEHIKWA